jgi:hypothetical protein
MGHCKSYSKFLTIYCNFAFNTRRILLYTFVFTSDQYKQTKEKENHKQQAKKTSGNRSPNLQSTGANTTLRRDTLVDCDHQVRLVEELDNRFYGQVRARQQRRREEHHGLRRRQLLPLRTSRREDPRCGHEVRLDHAPLAVPGRGGKGRRRFRLRRRGRGQARGAAPAAEPGVAKAGEGPGAEEPKVVAGGGGGRRAGLACGCHVRPGCRWLIYGWMRCALLDAE